MRRVVRNRAVLGATLGTLAVLLATGCSFEFSVGGSAVDSEEVARQASAVLEQEVGLAPESFICEEDLPAEVDASIYCELFVDGETYGVTVTTTSVEGSDVNFDIQVDETPLG